MSEEPAIDPRELRLLALKLQGLAVGESSKDLGIEDREISGAEETLAALQLSADHLEDAIGESIEAAEATTATPNEERRVRLLLRLTFNELLSVAADARLRAQMLRDLLERVGTSDEQGAHKEIEHLQHAADEIQATVDRLMEHIRHNR